MRYLLFAFFLTVTNVTSAQKNFKTIIAENKFTHIDGNEMSLTDIFKNNKNKVIYIDFWASWCGPCKKEMLASTNLRQKLQNEDIVFVYISIDKDEAIWKRSMKGLNITKTGQHYRRSQDEMIEFLKFFYIYSIPHYMIIGKDGQISNRDALPPSAPKVERQLRKLLKAKSKT